MLVYYAGAYKQPIRVLRHVALVAAACRHRHVRLGLPECRTSMCVPQTLVPHPRGACEEEEVVVAAFHSPRDAVAFALELQRGLLGLKWPRSVLEMEQFKPQYLAEMWVGSLRQGW